MGFFGYSLALLAASSVASPNPPELLPFQYFGPTKGSISTNGWSLRNAALELKSVGQGYLFTYLGQVNSARQQNGRMPLLSKLGQKYDPWPEGDVQQVCVLNAFEIEISGREVLSSATMRLIQPPRLEGAARSSVSRAYKDDESGLVAKIVDTLPTNANYVRRILILTATKRDVPVASVKLIRAFGQDAKVAGNVAGSPITFGNIFLALEHPMADNKIEPDTLVDGAGAIFGLKTLPPLASCSIRRKVPLRKGRSTTYSAVLGVAPNGQLRRAFTRYLERERPRRYQPFLHYNSWYDLGYFDKYTQEQCLERIRTIGEELAERRGVKLDGFLFDDGWDEPTSVWEFNSGFPNGFKPLTKAAKAYGAAPGIWLSPWGGYGGPREIRLKNGKARGYEVDSQGFALSGPKYYDRFRKVCLSLVIKNGVNQFKFDGTGSPDKQVKGSRFDSDFEAAITLIGDLRKARAGLFINLTTGTWPSPFWTRYADSIWRGGSDHSFAGVGPDREKWITYRDGDTYRGVVQKGPLYPLSSLMLHGIIFARSAERLNTDPSGAFRNEVRSYFGSGTQLQEMYITPSLLSQQNWDDLAEAAKWSRANADVLADTHWVGGDPNTLDVYGWASWSPGRGILTLRNPSDKPQAFCIEPRRVFELPDGYRASYRFADAFDGGKERVFAGSEEAKVIDLAPFEVLVMEATPL